MFLLLQVDNVRTLHASRQPKTELTKEQFLKLHLKFLAKYVKFCYKKLMRLISFEHMWLNVTDRHKQTESLVGIIVGWIRDFAFELYVTMYYVVDLLKEHFPGPIYDTLSQEFVKYQNYLEGFIFKDTTKMIMSWASRSRKDTLEQLDDAFKQAIVLFKKFKTDKFDHELPAIEDVSYITAEVHIFVSNLSDAVYDQRHSTDTIQQQQQSVAVKVKHALDEFKAIHAKVMEGDVNVVSQFARTMDRLLAQYNRPVQTKDELHRKTWYLVLGVLEVSTFLIARYHAEIEQLATYGGDDDVVTMNRRNMTRFSHTVAFSYDLPIWAHRLGLNALVHHAKQARIDDFITEDTAHKSGAVTPMLRNAMMQDLTRSRALDDYSFTVYHELLRIVQDKLSLLYKRFDYKWLLVVWYFLSARSYQVNFVRTAHATHKEDHLKALNIPTDQFQLMSQLAHDMRRSGIDVKKLKELSAYLENAWDEHWNVGSKFDLFVYFYDKELYFDFIRFKEFYHELVIGKWTDTKEQTKALKDARAESVVEPMQLITEYDHQMSQSLGQVATAGSSDILFFDLKDFTTNQSLIVSMRSSVDNKARAMWDAFTKLRNKKKMPGFFDKHFFSSLKGLYRQTETMLNEAQLMTQRLMDMSFGESSLNQKWLAQLTEFHLHCQTLFTQIRSVWHAKTESELGHALAELDLSTRDASSTSPKPTQSSTSGDDVVVRKRPMSPMEWTMRNFVEFMAQDNEKTRSYLARKLNELRDIMQPTHAQVEYLFHALYGAKPTTAQKELVNECLRESDQKMARRLVSSKFHLPSFFKLSSLARSMADTIQYCRLAYEMGLGLPLRYDHWDDLRKLVVILEADIDDSEPLHPWVDYIFEIHDTIEETKQTPKAILPRFNPLDITELEARSTMLLQYKLLHDPSDSVELDAYATHVRDRGFAIQIAAECVYLRSVSDHGSESMQILNRIMRLVAQWNRKWSVHRIDLHNATKVAKLSNHELAVYEIRLLVYVLNQYLALGGFVSSAMVPMETASQLRVGFVWEAIFLVTTLMESVVDAFCTDFDVTAKTRTLGMVTSQRNSKTTHKVEVELPTYREAALAAALCDAFYIPMTEQHSIKYTSPFLTRMNMAHPNAKKRPIDLLIACLES